MQPPAARKTARNQSVWSWPSGRDPRKVFRVENLVLAAPDLDFGVVSQRLITEQFGPAIRAITIYTNRRDRALGLSQSPMAGVRFGRLEGEEVGQTESEIFANVRNVHFIDVKGASDLFGHTYNRDNPAVPSDIALLIVTGASRHGAGQKMIRLL
ncbi:alpha/beta hydrolase [Ruegeria arenilitoris]|uniref:alpha/beta hydrolase n=1 Tax=Ruegeria arenilitoris TaxID=1173585 RepID=UPI00147E3621|nr:alpha/beta hydrolase [Ruegeria arenilitoris]